MPATDLAKILIKNQEGKYLILRSSEWPENPKRSLKPDLPGGMVEPGETPEQGVIRELYEEAGITIEPEDLVLAYEAPEVHEGQHYQRYIFFAEISDQPVTLSWEHDAYWWKTADEILSMEMRDPYPTVFKTMAEKKLLI